MLYQGSKAKIGKYIAAVIKQHQYSHFYEPFCGGLNLTQYLYGIKYCSDINPYLIAMWEAILYHDWEGPKEWTIEYYREVKDNKQDYPPEVVGWIGFCCFGGRFFDSFAGINTNTGQNYQLDYYNNITSQKKKLHNVNLTCRSYDSFEVRPGSLIYCDPPYQNTGGYFVQFDHYRFWEWCRVQSKNHTVLISEYAAPKDFKLIWAQPRTSKMRVGTGTSHQENLYIHESRFKETYFNIKGLL